MNPPLLKTSQSVKITAFDRTVEGVIQFASKNSKSLALTFEAILGGYAGVFAD